MFPAYGLLLLNWKMIWSKRCKTLKGKLFLEETAPDRHHSRLSTYPVSEAILSASHPLRFQVQMASDVEHYYPHSTDEKTESQMHFLHGGSTLFENGTVSNVVPAESTLSYCQTAEFEIPWWLAR